MGLQSWLEKKELSNFEGESGMKRLEQVLQQCGYEADNRFRFGSVLEVFFLDNPGAVEKLFEFIEEYHDDKFPGEDVEEHDEPDFDEDESDEDD